MVQLVESVPDHDQMQKSAIQYLYAFALSRRNQPGDRDKAIGILEKVGCVKLWLWEWYPRRCKLVSINLAKIVYVTSICTRSFVAAD